eukprot:1724838-Pleurochrysis_carterae.AAC.8
MANDLQSNLKGGCHGMEKQTLAEKGDGSCCNEPEKEVDFTWRSTILVYDIKFSPGKGRLTGVSKLQITDALEQQSPFAYGKLSAGWKETHKAPRGPKKKMARTR